MTKTMRVMQLTAAILLASTLALGTQAVGQTIKFTGNNVSYTTIFAAIEKQTGFGVIGLKEELNSAGKISVDVKNMKLKDFLDLIFKGTPYNFTLGTKTIFVKKKSASGHTSTHASQPVINIRGKVVNEIGQPVIASVIMKEANAGTTTNADGTFELRNVPSLGTLQISGITIETFEVQVTNSENISITARTRVNDLQEVIVRKGYYNEKKATTTGNVSSISSKEIEKQPVNNPLLALQGRVPGMEITQSTGMPGSGIGIQIRGQNSINNGRDPLYIIDGVPFTPQLLIYIGGPILGRGNSTPGNPFSYLNPADIEAIDILKDADATAIYGSRGANGVVLITTKKGKAGATKVDINMQNGRGMVGKKMNLLNTKQYLAMRYEAFKNDGATPNPAADYDMTLWDTTRYTDWQKELIGGAAKYTDIQASVSGGNINTQYLIGGGYHKETTVFPGDFDYQKGSVHFNINSVSASKKFRITLSGNFNRISSYLPGHDLTDEAIKLPPNAPAMYNTDGSLNWAPNSTGSTSWPYNNPGAFLLTKFKSNTSNLVSNATVGYTLIPGLEIKSNLGYASTRTSEVVAIPLISYDPASRPSRQRECQFGSTDISSWVVEPQISYQKNILKGELNFLAGTTIQQNTNDAQRLTANGFNSDLVLEDLKAATGIEVNETISAIYKYNAVFGRLNYNWEDKYIVNVTARRDGTSRFGPATQFHNFGAAGLGWVFTREKFLLPALHFISFGKLRASYGTTGSDQVGDYTFMDLYSSYSVGTPYQNASGIFPDRIFTPDLAWEETRKLEIGLELGLFSDRINLAASYYRNQSSNQLVDYSLPAITGFTSIKRNLDALVQNKGWEFELRSTNINKISFRWTMGLNITFNRNKLVSGAAGLSAFYQQKIGHPLSSQFVYHYLGVDPFTGSYMIADSHGIPTTNPNPATDKTVLFDRTPDYYGGLLNTFRYKSIEFEFLFHFIKRPQEQMYLYNYIPGYANPFPGGNQPVAVLDRWQQPGDVKPFARFSQNYSTVSMYTYVRDSDHMIGDASYIRLTNLSLSWQLPASWKKKVSLQNVRIYVLGQNLLTITNYEGLDPETLSSSTLPPLRTVTVGIQLTI